MCCKSGKKNKRCSIFCTSFIKILKIFVFFGSGRLLLPNMTRLSVTSMAIFAIIARRRVVLFQNGPFFPTVAGGAGLLVHFSPRAVKIAAFAFYHRAFNGHSLPEIVGFSYAEPIGAGRALLPGSGVLLRHICFLLAIQF